MRGLRHWIATAGAVAAAGVLVTTVGFAPPAGAAVAGLEIKTTREVQGKVGDKVAVGFEVTNRSKIDAPANDVIITIQAPGNAQLDPADYPQPRCGQISGGRTVNCHPGGPIAAGKSVQGSFKIVLKTAGNGNGRVAVKPGSSNDAFGVQVTGGPSPTATKSPTARASRSQTAAPTDTAGDQTIAPPEAGNGAVPLAEDPPKTTKTSGGMSFGFWVGIVAIVAALGLVGSLFYFRRKDRGEPDTGMHSIVPAPAGYQPGGGYAPAAPTVYGSPPAGQGDYGQGGYGQGGYAQGGHAQGGHPQQGVYPPAGYPPAPAPGPTQVINPGAAQSPPPSNDQTVMFRRPEDM